MDLIKLQSGFINPVKYRENVRYNAVKRISLESSRRIVTSNRDFDIVDFNLCNNWLIAAYTNFTATIYDVHRSDIASYEPKATWANYEDSTKGAFNCVNWNSGGSFFSYSGNSPYLYIVETENLLAIETHQFKDAHYIFQHKPHPTNNHLLAAATDLKKIPIIDLKSGNISYTVAEHTASVKSVAWAPLQEYTLVSSGDHELNYWDIRMTGKVFYKTEHIIGDVDKCFVQYKRHSPELQFIPGTNTIIGSTRERIYILDLIINKPRAYIIPHTQEMQPFTRLKYSLVGYCKPPIMFYPRDGFIDIVDLTNMRTISKLTGHIFSVQTTIYNELKNELYSSAKRDGNIVWVLDPKF